MQLYEAVELTEAHLLRFGLTGWKVEIMNTKRTLGQCCYATGSRFGEVAKSGTIKLSSLYVKNNTRESVEDTILHEIAHALCPVGSGHGLVWQRMAVKVGAKPQRCKATDEISMPSKYVAACRACGAKLKAHRMTPTMKKGLKYHAKCGYPAGALVWKSTGL